MKTINSADQTNVQGEDFPEILLNSSKRIISTYAEYPAGTSFALHHHFPCQFLYASKGVMTVGTDQGTWVVPESHGVWIPSDKNHSIETHTPLTQRNLYIQPVAAPIASKQCVVFAIPPLLRELIIYAADFPTDYPDHSHEDTTMIFILELLEKLERVPFLLPLPKDERLLLIANGLLADPGDEGTLTQWADRAGTTGRSISRLFRKETGMNFEQWRRQARLMIALRRLAAGEQVSSIALDLGYSSVSAFVAMFKKQLGKTPGQYFSD